MTIQPNTDRELMLTLLKQHAFVADLSDAQLALLADLARSRTVEPKALLAKEGEPAETFTLIVSGHIAIEIHTPARGTIRLQTIGPGEALGWSWLIVPHRWQFDARVIETAQVLEFDSAKLRESCERDHEFGYQLLKRLLTMIAARLSATRVQLLDVYQ